jgi:hypothetical protein
VIFNTFEQNLKVMLLLPWGQIGKTVELPDSSVHVLQTLIQFTVFGEFFDDR